MEHVLVEIALDLGVPAPWMREASPAAGDPYLLRMLARPEALRQAAAEWEEQANKFPDLSPPSHDRGDPTVGMIIERERAERDRTLAAALFIDVGVRQKGR